MIRSFSDKTTLPGLAAPGDWRAKKSYGLIGGRRRWLMPISWPNEIRLHLPLIQIRLRTGYVRPLFYQTTTDMGFLKILIIVTNVGTYANSDLQTGLWLSELTHIYDKAHQRGYQITIASPKGGLSPLDPVSLKPLMIDRMSKKYWQDPAFQELLQHTKSLDEVRPETFDIVYLAGGHGTMYDFPENPDLQKIITSHYEQNKLVVAICHGVGGLLDVKLSNGDYLINDKKITGFSWFEESLAGRKKEVPFNLEAALKARGADYRKAFIPMTSKVVVDGNLITGQNPFSSKQTARIVMREVDKRQNNVPANNTSKEKVVSSL